MSFGDFALSSAKSCFRSRSAWFGWIFAFDPVRKNCSTPLCRKLFITRIVYIVAIHSGNPICCNFQGACGNEVAIRLVIRLRSQLNLRNDTRTR